MPTNNGKPWNAQSQELEHERDPGRRDHRKNGAATAVSGASVVALSTYKSKSRASEIGTLKFDVPTPEDDERISRRIGVALLVVTFIVFAVLLWPYLSERFS